MKTHYVLLPKVSTITDKTVCEIETVLSKLTKPVVIDLDGVDSCVNNFYRLFEKYSGITLLNTDSKLLAMLYITKFDKFVKIYGDLVSYQDNARELINRRFHIV